MCSDDPIFGPNKNRILKNGLCEPGLKIVSEWQILKINFERV